jgi:hypothetical protein
MVRGIAVMRRRGDSFVNATQILKVAGIEKGRRTKILEKEILPGKHEIVQGGYGKYQGTWFAQSSDSNSAVWTEYVVLSGYHWSEAVTSLRSMVLPLYSLLCSISHLAQTPLGRSQRYPQLHLRDLSPLPHLSQILVLLEATHNRV